LAPKETTTPRSTGNDQNSKGERGADLPSVERRTSSQKTLSLTPERKGSGKGTGFLDPLLMKKGGQIESKSASVNQGHQKDGSRGVSPKKSTVDFNTKYKPGRNGKKKEEDSSRRHVRIRREKKEWQG